ncbi:MAG: Glycine betaine/carnitine/choline transport ATP-binding protein OpuCA [Candidatus Anoxychlamydiales bacterium]|nr:Glycine betaine/carnitine/choline transport ATP-binding protein OpuCA [Candidatus Anoxychlamydiales bacterium]NGX35591.1 Glycine betaine/carnitine/choline transport ATP-binding protein OpuCA [Candidatus Anoxychlamydiales bacterium]
MIKFQHVSKIYSNDLVAIDNISFEIKKGETLVLLGTSGSGKTTTMRMINKLTAPTSGKIFIDGVDIKNIDPIELRRQIGYAIQYIGLFNHMNVFENISIVPKLLKWNKEKINKRVDELLDLFGFDPSEYKHRFPRQLSGGEKQRIGVLRAIAADPPIILMDEPFGALDPITREQVQNEFIELESDIKKTVVFVTHDVFEAVKMADTIALMDKGKILQIATPKKLVNNPKNDLVKQFLGRHKFQLSLMTTSIKELVIKKNNNQNHSLFEGKNNSLTLRSSIIEAMDLFKETKLSDIAIFDRKKIIGILQKQDLLNSISNLLKEKEKV